MPKQKDANISPIMLTSKVAICFLIQGQLPIIKRDGNQDLSFVQVNEFFVMLAQCTLIKNEYGLDCCFASFMLYFHPN